MAKNVIGEGELIDDVGLRISEQHVDPASKVGHGDALIDVRGELATAIGVSGDIAVDNEVREITPERIEQVMSLLRDNFKKYFLKLGVAVIWSSIEADLRAEPKRIAKLEKLALRGGDLTLVGKLDNNKYLFDELSPECPEEDSGMTYQEALEFVNKKYGADLIPWERYKQHYYNHVIEYFPTKHLLQQFWLKHEGDDYSNSERVSITFVIVNKFRPVDYKCAAFRATIEV